jgi:hypothetical protein
VHQTVNAVLTHTVVPVAVTVTQMLLDLGSAELTAENPVVTNTAAKTTVSFFTYLSLGVVDDRTSVSLSQGTGWILKWV